jgi:hypothetical protein
MMARLEEKFDGHDSLIFPCDCGDCHYLRIEWDDEDPDWRFLWFEGAVWPQSFKQRIKWAFNALRGKVVFNDGVILNKEVLADLKEFVNKY